MWRWIKLDCVILKQPLVKVWNNLPYQNTCPIIARLKTFSKRNAKIYQWVQKLNGVPNQISIELRVHLFFGREKVFNCKLPLCKVQRSKSSLKILLLHFINLRFQLQFASSWVNKLVKLNMLPSAEFKSKQILQKQL